MHRPAVRTVASIHRFFAWLFALGAITFLLCPNLTVQTINTAGSLFRIFPPAPESDLRIWLTLAVGYMVLVAAFSWRVSVDPVGNRSMILLLVLGKLTSSFVSLMFFLFEQPTFLYLLNFLVDGSIVVVAGGCYLWLAAEEVGGQSAGPTRDRTRDLLRLLIVSLLGGETGPPGISPPIETLVWRYFQQLHPLGAAGLVAIVYVIEFGPYLFGPRRARFSHLTSPERVNYLEGWERSPIAQRRQLLHALKVVVALHHYGSPDVCASIGYDLAYLRRKLLTGPNAEHHRARLGVSQ